MQSQNLTFDILTTILKQGLKLFQFIPHYLMIVTCFSLISEIQNQASCFLLFPSLYVKLGRLPPGLGFIVTVQT